ncbi:unknown [Clostridium sp. CAG:710]|nr:unknown [Clostridium sp. CAG:710]
MYKDIEEIYKKKSPYNIIKKRTFWIYVVFILISLIFNFLNKIVPMILAFIAMLLIMKIVSEKVLNTKLHFNIGKRNENEITLPLIIRNAEKELFKDYSIKNNMYNEKTLLCIIDHYRNMIKNKMVGGNLLAILSIAIPAILSFYTKDGFDFNGLAIALPYLISFSIVIIMLYFSYSQFIEAKKFLKGEDGMIERLEEIFSELYIECINTNIVDKKNESKKQAKKKSKASKK